MQFLFSMTGGAFVILVSSAAAQPPGDRPRIVDKITIERQQVFEESDTTFLHAMVGKYANSIHILTDEDVIRRELLFKEGEPYNQQLVDESARHLRKLGILGGIRFTTDTLSDSTVSVTVQARDRWSLRPSMSVREGGGVSGFGIGIREDNFLGTAQKWNVGYDRLSDRRNPNGGEFGFEEPRTFGSWWTTSLQYRNADELRLASVDAERPFFADTATWAARGFAGVTRTRIRLYDDGLVTSESYLNQENEIGWVASSSGTDTKLQLAAAYVRTRSTADSMQARAFDNVDLVIGQLSILRREYVKGNFIENFGRVEDVPLGYQAGIAIGRNLYLTHRGGVDYFVRVFGQSSFAVQDQLFASYQASVSTYVVGREANEMTVMATALHAWRVTPHQTLISRMTTTIGSQWAPTSQLTLGSFSGLRGYRNFQFSGQRLMLVNLEDRAFSGLSVWFLRLGGTFFFDSGMVWHEGEGPFGHRFHSDAGLGIRVESGKNLGSGIFRFDIAYNFERRSIGIVLSTDHLFRGFSEMDFQPPIPGASTSGPTRGD